MFHSTKRTTEKPRSKAAPTTPKGTLTKTPTPKVDSEEESLKFEISADHVLPNLGLMKEERRRSECRAGAYSM